MINQNLTKELIITFANPMRTLKQNHRYLLMALLLPLFLLSLNVQSATPLLYQPDKLHQALIQPTKNIIIIDTRSAEEYSRSHIQNAINLPINQLQQTIGNVKKRIIGPLEFQKRIESLGLQQDDHLVFYAGSDPLPATRALWIFEFYGHPYNSILDGGFPAWQWQDLPTEQKINILPESQYSIRLNPKRFASKFETLVATQSENTLLIDARPKEEFEGRSSRTARTGHIPGAINLDFTTLFSTFNNEENQVQFFTFIKTEQFQKLIEKLPKKQHIILYCNAGSEASALYFSFRLMNKNVAIYDGSWVEWSVDKTLPITTLSNQSVSPIP